jgi:hypothetical protein
VQEEAELGLDALLYDAVADPVQRAINREVARVRARFVPLIEEIGEQDVDISGITTLTDAAMRIMTVRGFYHRVQAIYGEVLIEKRQAQVRRDASKAKAQAKVSELIRSDPEVRGITGQQAQMARAQNKAKAELALASGCNDLYLIVSGYTERVQSSLENLKYAAQDLREFIRTMRDAKLIGETGSMPEGSILGSGNKW